MQHIVIYGEEASSIEHAACEDLRADLERLTGAPCRMQPEGADVEPGAATYLVGTPASHRALAQACEANGIPLSDRHPGRGGGTIRTVPGAGGGPAVVLGGSDAKGAEWAAMEFSRRFLGTDPFRYWTGHEPARRPDFAPEDIDEELPPPAVPILCYFDNDNDELANMTEPLLQFDFATWKAVIDTLVRVRYNAVDLHDHLGRSEFYRWDFYRKLRPDYAVDLDFLDKVIDYAHRRGVMVQIPMYLAWAFRHISEDEATCWTRHRDRWMDTWRYYLEETPLGKGDLFLNRPRSQLWDTAYESSSGEDVPEVMTEVFTALGDLIRGHNPDATLICDLYTHGQDIWRSGRFNPPHDWVMAWPNDGFGRFAALPEEKRGYRFGAYMHAGYWLNHVVADPYPERIEESIRTLVVDRGCDAYCLVNGQTFRHFIHNLEAYSRACTDPVGFDGKAFLQGFAKRYVGPEAAPHFCAGLDALHAASEEGYVRLMHALMAEVEACREARPVEDLDGARARRDHTAGRVRRLNHALERFQAAASAAGDGADFCHDHGELPVRIFLETLQIHQALLEARIAWTLHQQSGRQDAALQAITAVAAAKGLLHRHLQTRARGDRDPRWAGWYDPAKRRPNGGFPTMAQLDAIPFGGGRSMPV